MLTLKTFPSMNISDVFNTSIVIYLYYIIYQVSDSVTMTAAMFGLSVF